MSDIKSRLLILHKHDESAVLLDVNILLGRPHGASCRSACFTESVKFPVFVFPLVFMSYVVSSGCNTSEITQNKTGRTGSRPKLHSARQSKLRSSTGRPMEILLQCLESRSKWEALSTFQLLHWNSLVATCPRYVPLGLKDFSPWTSYSSWRRSRYLLRPVARGPTQTASVIWRRSWNEGGGDPEGRRNLDVVPAERHSPDGVCGGSSSQCPNQAWTGTHVQNHTHTKPRILTAAFNSECKSWELTPNIIGCSQKDN